MRGQTGRSALTCGNVIGPSYPKMRGQPGVSKNAWTTLQGSDLGVSKNACSISACRTGIHGRYLALWQAPSMAAPGRPRFDDLAFVHAADQLAEDHAHE